MGKFSGGLLGIPINFITGNAGGPIAPDVLSNINLLGTDPITVTGTAATWTLDITVANASETQIGVVELATDAESIAGTDTTRAIVPSSLVAKLGAMTANSIPYGAGTAAALSWMPVGTDGQVILAATGAAPAFGTIASANGTIVFTGGANTLDAVTGGMVAISFAADGGGPQPPINGIMTLSGGNNISTDGTVANTIVFDLTGTTQFAVQVGDGVGALNSLPVGTTNTVLLGNTGANPSWGQVDLTTDVTGILPVPNGGTGVNTLADHGVMLGSGVGVVSVTAVGATNTVLHGNTGADPTYSAVDLAADVTGILPVPNGGTGLNTITDHGVMVGSGVGIVTPLAVGTDGQVLVGDSANDPIFATISSTDGTIDIVGGAGTLDLDLSADVQMTGIHGWNGSFLETSDVTVTEAGGVISLNIEQEGGGNLTAVFSDGFYTYVTAPDTVTLTAGTDIAPTLNYVYLLQATKILTASIVGWPATEFCAIAEVLCQSAASLGTDGAYKVHVWTDHVTSPSDQGHISMINRWVRQQNATWESGVAQTLTITPQGGAADNVIFTSTAGLVYQLHQHTFPAFPGTPDVYTVNDFTTPYNIVTDLNALLTDSANVSMSGKYFSLVIWGVVSEDGADCHLMVNLPGGSYNTQTQLLADSNNYANYTIPTDFIGTGFLIYQMDLRHQVAASGTWTSVRNLDLRGLLPNLAAGGSTAFATEFADNVFRIFDDGDNTKELAFECSAITTATTRTITMDDRDIDMDAVATTVASDAGNAVPAGGTLTIAGGTGISSAGAGSTVTMNLNSPVLVANGGSGAATFTDHGVLLGSAAGAFSVTAEGATNTVLHGNTGADPTYSAVDLAADVTGILPVPNGGTGVNTLTDHGVMLGSGVGTVTVTAEGATNTVLHGNTGADPTYSAVDMAADVTGTLPVGNGGTGLATITDHGVLLGSAAAAITPLAAAATGSTLMGNTGADPAFTGSPSFSGSVTAATTITATAGDITTGANLNLPTTTAALTAGVIEINSVRVFHTYGTNNLFVGQAAGNGTVTGNKNIGIGGGSLDAIAAGNNNTCIGFDSLTATTTGSANMGVGRQSLRDNVGGSFNVAIGDNAMVFATTGVRNVAIGTSALAGVGITTAQYNTCIGDGAGGGLTTTDSDNVCISNPGTATDNNTIRIGTNGAGDKQQNLCFIAGIRGITTGTSDAIAVLIDSNHQLGTASSSIRFKQNVKDMGNESSDITNLRPVTFEYKSHPGIKQYGLIAEEVAEVYPRLVVNDKEGLPETVKYHELPTIMLNEMKKMKSEIVNLRKELSELRSEYGNKG